MFKWLFKNYFIRILFLVVILIIVFIGVKDYDVHSRMCVQCVSNMSEKLAYADVELKKIKVTFHKNDGSGSTVTQIFMIGAGNNKFGYKEDGTPKWGRTGQFGRWDRDGYRLLGWSLSPTGTRAKYSIYSGVKDEWIRSYGPSVDLYAVWGEYVDLALLFGQSNMVGYAGNVNYEQNHKNIPFGIDDDIINNYHSYAYTEVSMKNNVAFEYRL